MNNKKSSTIFIIEDLDIDLIFINSPKSIRLMTIDFQLF